VDARYGGIEAGGTKWVCGIGDGRGQLISSVRFPTTTPAETIARAVEYLTQHGPLDSVGIGCFGPIDVRPGSPTFGQTLSTPKQGWSRVDVLRPIRESLGVPLVLDTDVNAAALGEWRWGHGAGLGAFVYMTIGTGIGGGVFANGGLLHGNLHPELGHMRIPHDRGRDPFEGSCPFHGDCLEGLASGEAMRQRGDAGAKCRDDDDLWALEAEYLGYALANISYTVSPQRIIVGGGVMKRSGLLDSVRVQLRGLLARYPEPTAAAADGDEYLAAPALGDDAGVLGAIALAHDLARAS
jgi:fructokinase